jgi:hypothetical protein
MFKNIYLSLAISIGVLAGILTGVIYLLADLGIATPFNFSGGEATLATTITSMVPPAFISWALFFAHGKGDGSDFWKTGICNTIGVIVAVLIVIIGVNVLATMCGLPVWVGLLIAVILGGGWMTFEATWDKVDYVPAAFCGCATAFALGVGTDIGAIVQLVLAFWIGIICAWLSNKWGAAMTKS